MNDAGSGPPSLRFQPTSAEVIHQTTEIGPVWVYAASGAQMRLFVENYEGLGGLASPGVRAVGPAEADYAACSVCVVLRTECNGQSCNKAFMPEVGGEIRVTQLGTAEGQRFSGSLEGLVLRQVRIDSTTYETVDVAGGERYALESYEWDEALPAPVCGGHGHLHGNTCHCDPGYRLDPNDSTNCIPI